MVQSTASQQVDEEVHAAMAGQHLDQPSLPGHTGPLMIGMGASTLATSAAPSAAAPSTSTAPPQPQPFPLLSLPASQGSSVGLSVPTLDQLKELQTKVKKGDVCLRWGLGTMESIRSEQPDMVQEQSQKLKTQLLHVDHILYDIKKASLFKEIPADWSGEAYATKMDEFDEAVKRAEVMTKVLKHHCIMEA